MTYRNLIQDTSLTEVRELKKLLDTLEDKKYDYKALSAYFDPETEICGHNCAWSCFDDSIQQLKNTIDSIDANEIQPKYLWRNLIMTFHIISQELLEILSISGLNYEMIKTSYPTLFEVKRYANFLKHPGVRIFLQQPEYIVCVSSSSEENAYPKLIDGLKKSFGDNYKGITKVEIDKFYKNENVKKQLLMQYKNQGGVQIILPAISDLFGDILKTMEKIISDYEKNPMLTEALKDISIEEHGYLDDLVASHYAWEAEITRGK